MAACRAAIAKAKAVGLKEDVAEAERILAEEEAWCMSGWKPQAPDGTSAGSVAFRQPPGERGSQEKVGRSRSGREHSRARGEALTKDAVDTVEKKNLFPCLP